MFENARGALSVKHERSRPGNTWLLIKIHQRGVQWKRGVVIYMMLHTSLLSNTTPIHCTPLPLHPPLMNTHCIRGC